MQESIMGLDQFKRNHALIQSSIERDLRNDLLVAVLIVVAGFGLTIWIGPEAGIVTGVVSSFMFGRYYLNRTKVPYFIKGIVLKKWEEKKIHRELETFYYYAELSNTISIHKDSKGTIKETVLPTNYSAEIFNTGFPKIQEGMEIILCFSGSGIYLGFIVGEEFVSYWDI